MIEPFKVSLERETRFELATSTLARLHSTTELFPLFACVKTGLRYRFWQTLSIKKPLYFLKYPFFVDCP